MKSRSVAKMAEGEAVRGDVQAVRGDVRDDVQAGKDAIALQNIRVPQPVFFCGVEPASMAVQNGKYMYVICMSHVRHMHVTTHVCHMYVTCDVCHMNVTCMSHHMHITCTVVVSPDLDHALSCLSREDPSLRVSTNADTGQTVLSGMGELHLEIIHDRLKRDFGVDCCLGKLQVSYKEQPTAPVTHKGGCGHT